MISLARTSTFCAATMCLWLASIGCGQAAQEPAAGRVPDAASTDPVATVNGVPIVRSELEALVAPQIAKLEEQAYALRRQQLDDLIASRLLADEARKRELTVDALVEREVTSQVAPVADADVQQFIETNRSRLPADPSSLEGQIRAYIAEERVNVRRQAFLEELRAAARIEVALAAPPVYRAPIDTAGAPARGRADAPVTIVEFSDFHCPFCRRVQPTLEQVLQRYPTQVRLVYKHFPLDNLHPEARRAAEASWCAQQQDRFWPYHDLLYEAGADASDTTLTRLAREAELDVAGFSRCLAGADARGAVDAHVQEGARYGITGTPGFFVNGRFLSGAQPFDAFVQLIEEELEGGQ